MPRVYGHDLYTARVLKKVAMERSHEYQEEHSRSLATNGVLGVSSKGIIVTLDTYCPGASYSSGTGWTLGHTEATIYQREHDDDEDSSQDPDNDIDNYKLIQALDTSSDETHVRVFNLSVLPVLVGPVQVIQDMYGDLFIVGAPQQIVVTTAGITKGSAGTCTVDGFSSITFSATAKFAATTSGKLCVAFPAPDNKSIYVGPAEC